MSEPLVAQILNLFPQEILVTTWFLFSRSCRGADSMECQTFHGITPGFTTPPACATPGALCICSQPFTHGSTTKKAPAPEFQWEGFHPTLNSPPRAPSIAVLFPSWQPLTMYFLLHSFINSWEKTQDCSRAAQKKRRNTCDRKRTMKFWRITGALVKFPLVCKLREKWTN